MTFDQFFGIFNQSPAQGNRVYAMALYAQAVLETGNFTSRLFKDHNNMFGMNPAKVRTRFYDDVTSSSEGSKASYASPTQSMLDRVDLDFYNKVSLPTQVDEVRRYMSVVQSKGYATDASYVAKWAEVLKRLADSDVIGDANEDFDDEPETAGFSKMIPWAIGIIIVVIIWKKFRHKLPF